MPLPVVRLLASGPARLPLVLLLMLPEPDLARTGGRLPLFRLPHRPFVPGRASGKPLT